MVAAGNVRFQRIPDDENLRAIVHSELVEGVIENTSGGLGGSHAAGNKDSVKHIPEPGTFQPAGLNALHSVGHHRDRCHFRKFFQGVCRSGNVSACSDSVVR